jgi:arsenite methyltransferase
MGAMATLGVAAGYFYSTGPGKLSVWKELLDELGLRGDEHVLDIGCGRGAASSSRQPTGDRRNRVGRRVIKSLH